VKRKECDIKITSAKADFVYRKLTKKTICRGFSKCIIKSSLAPSQLFSLNDASLSKNINMRNTEGDFLGRTVFFPLRKYIFSEDVQLINARPHGIIK